MRTEKIIGRQRPLNLSSIGESFRLLFVMLLALAPIVVLAGHYEVTYSGGGPVQITGPSGSTWTKPYANGALFNPGRSGSGVSSDYFPPPLSGPVGPGSVSCSGQITATFTWTESYPGDSELPPDAVFVRELATATWAGDSGSASNGLGHAVVNTLDGGTSTGERVRAIEQPGTQFTVSASPVAQATVSSQSPNGYLAASAGIVYWAGVSRIQLVIDGAFQNLSCVIGQQVRARVYVENLSPDIQTSNWTVGNGDAFRSYTMSTESASLQNGWSTESNSLTCALRLPGFTTFSCDVEIPEWGVNVSLSRTLAVESPEITGIQQPIGAPGLRLTTFGYVIVLEGATLGNELWGTFWSQSVNNWGGTWAYVQLIKPGRRRLTFANQWEHCGHYGYWVLDGSVPYPAWSTLPPPFWPVNGQTYFTGDAPRNGLDGFAEVRVDEDFRTYTMYIPPDTSVGTSFPVVLRRLDWYWRGTCIRTGGGTYSLTGANASNWDAGEHQPQPEWSDVLLASEIFP